MQNLIQALKLPRLVELTKTLVSIPSVTNQKHEIADWAYAHFKAIGLSQVQRLAVQDSGDTVVGIVDGPASGPTMKINFHILEC